MISLRFIALSIDRKLILPHSCRECPKLYTSYTCFQSQNIKVYKRQILIYFKFNNLHDTHIPCHLHSSTPNIHTNTSCYTKKKEKKNPSWLYVTILKELFPFMELVLQLDQTTFKEVISVSENRHTCTL